jgi:nucleotide-binding universal stress UspA family protein
VTLDPERVTVRWLPEIGKRENPRELRVARGLIWGRGMDLVHRILVPIDFSESSRRALAYAVALAERIDAAVDLLHVHEPYVGWAFAPLDGLAFDDGSSELAAVTEAGHTLAQWTEEVARRSRVSVHGRLEHGDTLHTILRIAERGRYDLLVVGPHGPPGSALHLFGGLARKLGQRATCPVLTVRPPRATPRKQRAAMRVMS